MGSCVQQFFTAQALHLRDGRFDLLAKCYVTPLVIALPDPDKPVSILRSRARVETFFRAKFEGLAEAGIAYLRAAVLETESTGRERHVATVSWYYVAPGGAREGETVARYYLSKRSGQLAVEMIEFRHLAFPVIADWVQAGGRDPSQSAPSGATLH